VDGQPGLEGYYLEHDHDLAPEERLRFAPEEDAPDFDPARAPRLPTGDWPPARLGKARRGYAMDYVRTAIPEAIALFGPDGARALLGLTGRLIGMQLHAGTAGRLGVAGTSAEDFARFLVAMARAQGDEAATFADGAGVRQATWTLMRGVPAPDGAAFDIWNSLWEGALAAHNRRLALQVTRRPDDGGGRIEWRVSRSVTP
jgi:hypothetical protein